MTDTPHIPGVEIDDIDLMAEAMWRHEAKDMQAAHHARMSQVWAEQAEQLRDKWRGLATAAREALAARIVPERRADLIRRLQQIANHNWGMSFLAHLPETANEAAAALAASPAIPKQEGVGPVATKPFEVGSKGREDWVPVSRQTLARLGDHKVLRAGIEKLSPAECKRIGMSKDESNAVEALWSLLEADDFHVVDASPSTAGRVERLETDIAAAHKIAARIRQITQDVWDKKPGYTDRQAWDDLHGQAMQLLGWDVASRQALGDRS